MKIQFQNPGITIFESALYRTCSAVISIGQSLIVVDPNWLPVEIQFIKDFIETNYPEHDKYLLFTHSDYDHIIGYGAFSGYKVIASLDFVQKTDKKDILQQINEFDDQYYIIRPYPIEFPRVDYVIENNGQCITLHGESLFFYLAPGHINNGLITVIPSHQLCIAGDYLSNIEIPMVDYSFRHYLYTLDSFLNIIKQYDINLLMTGHGDFASGFQEISNRIQDDKEYLNFVMSGMEDEKVFQNYLLKKGSLTQNNSIHDKNKKLFLSSPGKEN